MIASAKETERIRALLVEDDHEDAEIFRRYVEDLPAYDLEIMHVTGEAEAELLLAKEQVDLIFLDLNLGPQGSGRRLLWRLQAEKVDTPVIVVTGLDNAARAAETMKRGAYDYLVKDDLSTNLLERTVRNVRERYFLEQERLRMIKKLTDLTITDELTSLSNRRHLVRKLEEEVVRSDRSGRPFAVLMLDLDYFKEVNDGHGHQAGDEVLIECAGVLRRNVRGSDTVARYGGDEFCVLLPDTPASGTCVVAEKLREDMKSLPEPVPTVSIGVAFWEPGRSAAEILRWADQELYKAKRGGRDRVVIATTRSGGDALAKTSETQAG